MIPLDYGQFYSISAETTIGASLYALRAASKVTEPCAAAPSLTAAAAFAVIATTAIAQPANDLPRIMLVSRNEDTANMVVGGYPHWSALLSGLHEFGYVEGENIIIER